MNRMPKIKQREGCIKCGRTDRWMLGRVAKDKRGEKLIVGVCFECMAKEAEDKVLKGGKQE